MRVPNFPYSFTSISNSNAQSYGNYGQTRTYNGYGSGRSYIALY